MNVGLKHCHSYFRNIHEQGKITRIKHTILFYGTAGGSLLIADTVASLRVACAVSQHAVFQCECLLAQVTPEWPLPYNRSTHKYHTRQI